MSCKPCLFAPSRSNEEPSSPELWPLSHLLDAVLFVPDKPMTAWIPTQRASQLLGQGHRETSSCQNFPWKEDLYHVSGRLDMCTTWEPKESPGPQKCQPYWGSGLALRVFQTRTHPYLTNRCLYQKVHSGVTSSPYIG